MQIFNSDFNIALSDGLKSNFNEVTVEVVECPDLQAAPFHLACNGDTNSNFISDGFIKYNFKLHIQLGLNGSATICEIGGPPYLLPLVDRTKLYDLKEISRKLMHSSSEIFSIGAGAGYHPFLNENCEVIVMQR